jgi:hypothetical protein
VNDESAASESSTAPTRKRPRVESHTNLLWILLDKPSVVEWAREVKRAWFSQGNGPLGLGAKRGASTGAIGHIGRRGGTAELTDWEEGQNGRAQHKPDSSLLPVPSQPRVDIGGKLVVCSVQVDRKEMWRKVKSKFHFRAL